MFLHQLQYSLLFETDKIETIYKWMDAVIRHSFQPRAAVSPDSTIYKTITWYKQYPLCSCLQSLGSNSFTEAKIVNRASSTFILRIY